MSDTTEPLDLDALRKRYTADEPKPCRVCGGPLSIQSMGGGRATEWACSDRPHRQEGDPNDLEWYEHYRQSKWTQFRRGDPEVLEALAEIERLRAEPAEARLNPGHEINLTCGHCRRCPATRETRRDTGPAMPPLGAVLSAAVAVVADVRNRGGVDRKTLSRWLRADQDLLAALDAAVEAAAPGAADELVRIWRGAR